MAKILGTFVVPPGVFVLALAGLLFALWVVTSRTADEEKPARVGVRAAWIVLSALLVLLYLASIGATRGLLVAPLESRHPPIASDARPDVIVILGGGLVAGSREATCGASPTRTSLKRLVYGRELATRLGAPVITSGGDPFDEGDTTEAGLMREQLIALGSKPASVTAEGRSANTQENAIFVAEIVRERGYERLALVTSAMHMPRAVAAFKAQGLDVLPAPTDYTSLDSKASYASLLPAADNMKLIESALHEYVGILYYKLAYGV